jgi:hypothetical protein
MHTWVRRGEMHTGFWWGNLKEIDILENLGVGGSVILKSLTNRLGWFQLVHLAEDEDKCSTLVNRNKPLDFVKEWKFLTS